MRLPTLKDKDCERLYQMSKKGWWNTLEPEVETTMREAKEAIERCAKGQPTNLNRRRYL